MAIISPAHEEFSLRLTKDNLQKLFDEHLSERPARGADGTSLPRFKENVSQEIDLIIKKTNDGTYKFTRYRQKLIIKSANSPPRIISIPTIRDRLTLKLVAQALAEVYPTHIAKLPHGMVRDIHQISKQESKDNTFLRLDIERFFPSIDHKILMQILEKKIRSKDTLSLIEKAIKTPTGLNSNSPDKGIPQGLSISNILSSIYLAEIDEIMRSNSNLNYFRYVDDILIIAPKKVAEAASKTLPKLIQEKRNLTCHEIGTQGKSSISTTHDGMDYLGYNFQSELISVRTSSYKKMFANLIALFTSMKYKGNNRAAIWRLNLRISGCIYNGKRVGWLFYFSQTDDIKQLQRLDYFCKKNGKKFLTSPDQKRVKRFVKTYYEIRFNGSSSQYFPNFDEFDDDQKKVALRWLLPKRAHAALDDMGSEKLSDKFNKLIRREINEVERDMLDAIS